MPPDNADARVPSGDRVVSNECPACQSTQVIVALSTVAADYLTCKSCAHSWSVARIEASVAYRISKIVGLIRPVRS